MDTPARPWVITAVRSRHNGSGVGVRYLTSYRATRAEAREVARWLRSQGYLAGVQPTSRYRGSPS